LGDRKCQRKLRKSFVGHPETILFSRISLERLFQHPRLFTTTISLLHSGKHFFSFPFWLTGHKGCSGKTRPSQLAQMVLPPPLREKDILIAAVSVAEKGRS
jgi:hypothetical protein